MSPVFITEKNPCTPILTKRPTFIVDFYLKYNACLIRSGRSCTIKIHENESAHAPIFTRTQAPIKPFGKNRTCAVAFSVVCSLHDDYRLFGLGRRLMSRFIAGRPVPRKPVFTNQLAKGVNWDIAIFPLDDRCGSITSCEHNSVHTFYVRSYFTELLCWKEMSKDICKINCIYHRVNCAHNIFMVYLFLLYASIISVIFSLT